MDNEYNNNNDRDDFQNTDPINNSHEGLNNNQLGGDAMGDTYKYSFEEKTPDNIHDKKQEKYVTKKGLAATVAICIALSSAVGFGGGYLASSLNRNGKITGGNGSVGYETIIKTAVNDGEASGSMSVSDIVEESADTVVEIKTSVTTQGFMGQQVSEGAGSGVIISENGYIVTNNHVIEDASSVNIRLRDGETYEAVLVGTDEKTDIAVLKIEASGLKSAVLGESGSLKVGQSVVAIGNPLGELGGTVTSGIVSALDREIQLDGETMNLLQIDAAINPGNSGGGLFDGQGNLVGVVVAKSAGTGVEGLGFAIPIDDAKKIIDDLINNGYVTGRVVLGVSVYEITDRESARRFGTNYLGVYVNEVTEGSNAARAGIKKGDSIVSINGEEISTVEDLTSILGDHSVGDTLKIRVLRANEYVDLQVVAEETKGQ
ncbi:S1C family serine protease [Alloiococcus sp. CFN-8]|uniref:S1C family serine protease n=1 Tax=Alloiococcus sp. CFN-8 TaxID=3416081 RepID=UPI003CE93F9A